MNFFVEFYHLEDLIEIMSHEDGSFDRRRRHNLNFAVPSLPTHLSQLIATEHFFFVKNKKKKNRQFIDENTKNAVPVGCI